MSDSIPTYRCEGGQQLTLTNSDWLVENLSARGYDCYIKIFNESEREILDSFVKENKFSRENLLSYLNNGGKDIEMLLEHVTIRQRDKWETPEEKYYSDANVRNGLIPSISYWHRPEESYE